MSGGAETRPCPSCGQDSPGEEIGTASSLAYCRCPIHGPWRAKNPAAVALGHLGGKARSKSMTKKQKSENGERAANARWRKRRLAQNVVPGRRRA